MQNYQELDEEGRDVTGINDEINFPLGPGALPEILAQRDALAEVLADALNDGDSEILGEEWLTAAEAALKAAGR